MGTMDGRVLWSVSAEVELIPASTTKVFTTGFSRTTMGGEGRITTRVIGDGTLEPATGRWLGTWALELGGDPTLERTGRGGPTLRELAKQLRARGIATLVRVRSRIASRTGEPASYVSLDLVVRLPGPALRPAGRAGHAAREHHLAHLRPGRDIGSPPQLVSAFPDGVDRLVRMAATTVGGAGRRLSLRADSDGGWTLNGTIGVERRSAGLSAVAHDPSRLLAAVWASALERAGIRWLMRGGPVSLAAPRAVVLAQVESATLDSVAIEINRRSLNIGAELMLQWGAGSQTTGPALVTQHVRQVVGPMARV